MPHLTALIITYHPDPSLLNRLLLALAPQVTQGRVIHNGSAVDFPASVVLPVGFSCDYLGDNLGIATALNHGCAWAEAEGADYILTFDQDSEPAPDMVAVLLAVLRMAVLLGVCCCGVCMNALFKQKAKRSAYLFRIGVACVRHC